MRDLLPNLRLLTTTAARHLVDDPLLLVVQTARRMRNAWRAPLARLVGAGTTPDRPTVRHALAEFIADRPARAAAALDRCRTARTRSGRRLHAELAVQLSLSLPPTAGAGARAREAWNRGDISGAIEHARCGGSRRYAERLESERRTMERGFRLAARAAETDSPTRRRGDGGLRVLHILTNSLPHTQSGYAIRSHSILTAQRAAGMDARAVTRVGYPVTVGRLNARVSEHVDSVPYHRILSARLANLPAMRLQQMVDLALPLARDLAPEVLHTTTNYTNALVTEALARALGVPWVYEVRGLLEETWLASRHAGSRDAARTSERYALLRAKETEMMLAADHVVVLSEVSRREVLDRGVPEGQVTVVPNGIDEQLLTKHLEPRAARRRLRLPEDGFWIGSVSSLVDYEGFDILLRSAALLREEGHDVRVLLAGDGVSRPALVQLAADLGMSEAVTFPGRVAREDAWLWHRALDVFAVPRRDLAVCREVTPLKPIEAMAAGRPVIASDLPALRELVGLPGAGELISAGRPLALTAALRRLAEDPDLRSQYGAAGRAFAGTRTWEKNAEAYRTLYQRLGVSK